jgi:hypothetical protein
MTMIDRTGQFPEGIGGKPLTIAEQLEKHRGVMPLSRFAAVVGISYDTAYNWIRECSLPAVKARGSYWIDGVEAAIWWRQHYTTAIAKPPAPRRTRPTKAAPAPAVLAAPPKTRAAAGSRA